MKVGNILNFRDAINTHLATDYMEVFPNGSPEEFAFIAKIPQGERSYPKGWYGSKQTPLLVRLAWWASYAGTATFPIEAHPDPDYGGLTRGPCHARNAKPTPRPFKPC